MITSRESLSVAEAKQFLSKQNEKEAELNAFIEKFIKIKPEQTKDFREKLENLNLMKLKKDHISKIIDMLPEDSEDLNKIFTEVSLDENETKQILEVVKEFK